MCITNDSVYVDLKRNEEELIKMEKINCLKMWQNGDVTVWGKAWMLLSGWGKYIQRPFLPTVINKTINELVFSTIESSYILQRYIFCLSTNTCLFFFCLYLYEPHQRWIPSLCDRREVCDIHCDHRKTSVGTIFYFWFVW